VDLHELRFFVVSDHVAKEGELFPRLALDVELLVEAPLDDLEFERAVFDLGV